ncbi:hypothetical protein HNO92_004422 [Chromobacterium alkanivorans]|uniref:glycoside hydrolase n=1 Tax=Chromobacterium alkanivorans TaxID=1071719 RepID=UPI0023EE939F|nr:glycoside hydrolase [Chromobacterium alkanivorans]MCS3806813.1 hypothetical protein [Chromobacterium alkanivorans]MCS3821015.1 hypothetical protein [Chromobacterium alkanivorans]MCS3876073.1 hypothetical protein [Chromobacterium alkanivorans]
MPITPRFLVLALAAMSLPLSAWAQIRLENAQWRVALDPATLAVTATPAGQPPLAVSSGGPARAVADLRADEAGAAWSWEQGRYRLSARLHGPDLSLTVQAEAGAAETVPLLRQPAAAMGRGLLLPLAEGSYAPAGDPLWLDFLPRFAGDGLNTSENLSLPLWGMDYGANSLHWLLLNPFNNRLRISRDGAGLSLALSHDFNAVNQREPMTLLLHLADGDPLAGAKRYRQWLIEAGRFESLADKMRAQPETAKLVGASHAYLWGNDLLGAADVSDWERWLSLLRGDSALARRLRGRFDAEAAAALRTAAARPDGYQRRVLLAAFNQAATAEARAGWLSAAPEWSKLAAPYRRLRREVKEVFGAALGPADDWGGGLSLRTLRALREAGLERLWLGMDNWEGGLWQPQAMAEGVSAGYLMASYDSYQTALQPGRREDWLTAQLGAAAYRDCGITLASGRRKSGFQQSGYYTNPECVRPVLRQRSQALHRALGFNSWFLDAYATGMVFDDYTPGRRMSQAGMAAGNERSMAWVRDRFGVPVGSENGNAATSLGIAFAHGMQVPVLGWGDVDLQKNPKSPYFLGRWFPANQPEVFFRSVPLKQPYLNIYYQPGYRLPLYQAAFHDSIVTTNHWLYDNLKFSNAYADNLLAQWLYNTPPLWHLSTESLEKRLPLMRCADQVFRPLHRQLATQAMTGFAWLTPDRLSQQTRFADGSRLTVNFSAEPRQLEGRELAGRAMRVQLSGQPERTVSLKDCEPAPA